MIIHEENQILANPEMTSVKIQYCLSLSQYQYLTYYLAVVIQLSYVFQVINYTFCAYFLSLIVDLVVLCAL